MCFNYALSVQQESLIGHFEAEFASNQTILDGLFTNPVFLANGFTHPQMPVITNKDPKVIQAFSWGLIPPWIKSEDDAKNIQKRTLNARSETAFEKPAFRSSIVRKRCLVPATGFYEWQDVNKKKFPHYIYLKDQEIMSFAGIWDEWVNQETGEIMRTYSILTTDANPLMAKIHNIKKRMPVILPRELEQTWLQEENQSVLQELLTALPEDKMASHSISKLINSRDRDSNVPEVQNEHFYPELQVQKGLFD